MTVKIDRGEIYRDESGQWRFRIVAANNQILAWGEAYENRVDCYDALAALVDHVLIVEGRPDRSTPKPRPDETDGGLRAD